MADFFTESLFELQIQARKWLETDCNSLLNLDNWESKLGVGRTGYCSGGLIEKAGVNISLVKGSCLPTTATLTRPDLQKAPFAVQGLSMIFHPESPHAPTAHLNIRRFEVFTEQGRVVWFGGGFDFSPYFMKVDDAVKTHLDIARFLSAYDKSLYKSWSDNCDSYFYLPHRAEPRGIGGIFFDDFILNNNEEASVDFMIEQVCLFYRIYRDMVSTAQYSYTEREKAFQSWRRGRYVEFNLLYDRGTRFGLESGGRTESILISLPPQAQWLYAGNQHFEAEQQQWEHLISATEQAKNRLKSGFLTKDELLLDF